MSTGLTQVIKAHAEAHEAPGAVQWYVDKFTIDCDAGEFWAMVEQAMPDVRAQVARELLAADRDYSEDDAGMAYDHLLGILGRMADGETGTGGT
jgi:hypothetical protein